MHGSADLRLKLFNHLDDLLHRRDVCVHLGAKGGRGESAKVKFLESMKIVGN